MDNLDEIRAIWHSAKTDSLPASGEMVQIIKKFRTQKLLKIIALIVIVLALIGVMVMVMFNYKSTMLTTRIGEVLIILAGVILATASFSSLVRFYRLSDCSNKDFIAFLEHTRQRQLFYYKKTQVAGMICCAAGLLIYVYEAVHTNVYWFVGMYSGLVIYLSVLWFVVRPRMFKRQEKKITAKIEELKAIAEQINS